MDDHTVGGAVNAVRAPNQWGGTGARAGEGKLVCTKERKPQLWIRVVYTPVGGWQTAPAGVLAPRARPRVGCFPEVGSLNLTASLGRVMIPFNG